MDGKDDYNQYFTKPENEFIKSFTDVNWFNKNKCKTDDFVNDPDAYCKNCCEKKFLLGKSRTRRVRCNFLNNNLDKERGLYNKYKTNLFPDSQDNERPSIDAETITESKDNSTEAAGLDTFDDNNSGWKEYSPSNRENMQKVGQIRYLFDLYMMNENTNKKGTIPYENKKDTYTYKINELAKSLQEHSERIPNPKGYGYKYRIVPQADLNSDVKKEINSILKSINSYSRLDGGYRKRKGNKKTRKGKKHRRSLRKKKFTKRRK